MSKAAHIPMRTCLGCGSKSPKSVMLRFVAVSGAVKSDEKQRLPGRGAYLCRNRTCLENLISSGRGILKQKPNWDEPTLARLRILLDTSGADKAPRADQRGI